MINVGTYKKEAYEQALSLRRRGFTYTEIAKICDVSRGTVSNWLKHELFSQSVAVTNKKRAAEDNKKRIALVNKARTTERKQQYASVLHMAEVEYKNYRSHPLFTAGLMVYLAEGDLGDDHLIRLSSSRTDLQKIFMKFLLDYLGVAKANIRFWLLLYPDLDEVTCMKHWSRKMGISVANFHKSQVIKGRSSKPTLHFGVGNTIIGSTLLKKKLLRWLELASKELQK